MSDSEVKAAIAERLKAAAQELTTAMLDAARAGLLVEIDVDSDWFDRRTKVHVVTVKVFQPL
jgi:hypothetical protein